MDYAQWIFATLVELAVVLGGLSSMTLMTRNSVSSFFLWFCCCSHVLSCFGFSNMLVMFPVHRDEYSTYGDSIRSQLADWEAKPICHHHRSRLRKIHPKERITQPQTQKNGPFGCSSENKPVLLYLILQLLPESSKFEFQSLRLSDHSKKCSVVSIF